MDFSYCDFSGADPNADDPSVDYKYEYNQLYLGVNDNGKYGRLLWLKMIFQANLSYTITMFLEV